MSRLFFLALLVPLFPLLGSFWNHISAMVMSGLAWATLLGVLLNVSDTPDQWIFIAQFPLLALVSYLSIRLSYKQAKDFETSAESGVQDLGPLHKSIKESVAQSEKEERQSLQIYGAARALAEALSWKDMAPRLTSSVQKVFGGYEFLLFAFGEKGERTCLHRRGSWSQDFPLEGDVPAQASMVQPGQSTEVVPLLCVPIYTGQQDHRRMNGLLALKAPGGDKSNEELLNAGREFGEQLGMALDKALLFAQMEKHSRIDGLTGVLRRQVFMERLDEEFKRAAVFNTPFSLMMVDIDHFKAINDSHGHGAGDEVLRKVGEILRESVYETDFVGRYGGEEFIILLPKAQKDGVIRKAESLRQRIQQETISFGFDQMKVTVSIGVAHYPKSGSNRDELIACADKLLYQAKESGRNRVIED